MGSSWKRQCVEEPSYHDDRSMGEHAFLAFTQSERNSVSKLDKFCQSTRAPDHEIHQVIPIVKDHITHEGLDIIEKRLTPGKHATQYRIFVIAPLQHGMEQQGQQVEAEQKGGEVLFAMTKVMLHMVALGLEHIV